MQRVYAFFVAALALALILFIGGRGLLNADVEHYQAEEAEFIARAFAWVVGLELKGGEPGQSQQALSALKPKLRHLRAAAAIGEAGWLANTEPKGRSEAALKSLKARRAKLQAAGLSQEAELAGEQVSAWALSPGALVEVVTDRTPLPLVPQSLLFFVALGGAGVFWFFARAMKAAPALIFGVLMLAGQAFVSARTIVHERAMGEAMIASVQTGLVEQLRDGGLFSLASEAEMKASLLPALNGPAPGEGIAGLKAGPLRLGVRGAQTRASGLVGDSELYFSNARLEEAVREKAEAPTWLGLGGGGAALVIFLLGGLLRRAPKAQED